MRGTGSATDLSKSIYSLKQQQNWQALRWAQIVGFHSSDSKPRPDTISAYAGAIQSLLIVGPGGSQAESG